MAGGPKLRPEFHRTRPVGTVAATERIGHRRSWKVPFSSAQDQLRIKVSTAEAPLDDRFDSNEHCESRRDGLPTDEWCQNHSESENDQKKDWASIREALDSEQELPARIACRAGLRKNGSFQ
jgi:hypothetical protein